MSTKLNKKIEEWRARIGYESALNALIEAGVSKSAAQKLLAGTYISEPKRLLFQAIEKAMKESA